jgi:signal transduction histidine kinase
LSELTAASFGDFIASRIRAEHVAISSRWLERLRALVLVDANDVFPTDHLLDHIPALIREVADYIGVPEIEAVSSNTAIMTKAQELGELRYTQQASVHQLLAEYRLLAGILSHFVQEELQQLGMAPLAEEALEVMRRINEAIWILMQTTVNTFVSQYTATIANQTSKLDSFNRMVSHELRQPLGVLISLVPLLKSDLTGVQGVDRSHLLSVMDRNVVRLGQLLDQLDVLSRLQAVGSDSPEIQRTSISSVAWEVARQLREMADARGVECFVEDDLPEVTIDKARLELILTNLISNAIKYSDPAKAQRYVRVERGPADDPRLVGFTVSDNGLGIPDDSLSTIFRRYTRAHAARDEELGIRGSGLGLAIAAECADAVGGAIRVESVVGAGTIFFVTVPIEPS